jgi:citrate lyase subunit beta/citryl-CoA lyase
VQAHGADDAEAEVIRSFLFVPADSERKLAKAVDSGADALILDLEDSVAAENRPAARKQVAEFLRGRHVANAWVRINPLSTSDADTDLHAILPEAPAGIVLPKPAGPEDSRRLADRLTGLENEFGLEPGSTRLLPIATEQPAAIFSMAAYAGVTRRLAALTWGAEDLSAAVGASQTRDAEGQWLPPYQLARSLCLFAAAAAGVDAIDTVFTDFRNAEGLAKYAAAARRDGFRGMLAIHPAQVAVINDAFCPTRREIERAEKIVALFDSQPGAGVVGLEGEMLDRPHYTQAKNLLELAERLQLKNH